MVGLREGRRNELILSGCLVNRRYLITQKIHDPTSDFQHAMKMSGTIWVLAALLAVGASEQTTVRRCCPWGQKLNQNLECVSWPEPWVQNVVSKDLQELVDFDETVKQWKVIVERPSCAHPEVVAFPNVILIENGSLWLREKHVEDGRLFCVDNNEAIICPQEAAPSQQRRRVYINKCCAHTTLYSQDEVKCVEDMTGRNSSTDGLLGPVGAAAVDENMTHWDVGFPRCDDGAITAGKLGERGAQLLGDGSLELPASKVRFNAIYRILIDISCKLF